MNSQNNTQTYSQFLQSVNEGVNKLFKDYGHTKDLKSVPLFNYAKIMGIEEDVSSKHETGNDQTRKEKMLQKIPSQYHHMIEHFYDANTFPEIKELNNAVSGSYYNEGWGGCFEVGHFANGQLDGQWLLSYGNKMYIWEFQMWDFNRGVFQIWDHIEVWEFRNGEFFWFGVEGGIGDVFIYSHWGKKIGAIADFYSLHEQLIIRQYINFLQFWETFHFNEEFQKIQEKKKEIISRYEFHDFLGARHYNEVISDKERDFLEKIATTTKLRNIVIPVFFASKWPQDFKAEMIKILTEGKMGNHIFPDDFSRESYIQDFIYYYLHDKFSFQDLEKMYQENPKKFLKLLGLFNTSLRQEDPMILDFIKKHPNISYYEAKSFGDVVVSHGHYHRFVANQDFVFSFRKILFQNFVKKLPKTSWKAYRGIVFKTKGDRDKFISDTNLLGNEIQNFSIHKSVADDFSRWDFGVLIEVESDEIKTVAGELWDHEWHSWFEHGTEFEFTHIDKTINPWKVYARVKKWKTIKA